MTKRHLAIFMVFVTLLSVLHVLAADEVPSNDPTVNENANACYEGGSMAGKCGDDIVLWQAGWYLIRFEAGIYTRETFPTGFAWVLPPLPEEEVTINTDCYIQVGPAEFELAPSAVLNGANGGTFYWNSPTDLESSLNGWQIWDSGVWSVGHYGDCSPL
ncbi:MAG: hypothetical protein J0M33_24565 [Anaerolineae bacterium]|nr:hypothetical protein [Anaerolineae bacterium]